jgi:P27 family predicted phage terminase small subunit
MATKGPRPTPTELRLARGTHRNTRHGDASQEPKGDTIPLPDPPESLKEHGVQKWIECGQKLSLLGLLESRYLDALEMYCRAWDRLAFYETTLEQTGEFFVAESGYVGRHPAANGAKEARDEIRRYQVEFGLTPSSSTGIKVSGSTKRGVPNRAKDIG